MTHTSRPRFLLGVFLSAVASLTWGAANPAPVAMVSDLQGKASMISGGTRVPVAMLADLEPGVQIELEAGARMVALYLDGSGEYLMTGPALVAFQAREPQAIKGAPPQRRGVLGGKAGADVRIKPVGSVQGALVMRSVGPRSRIRLLDPSGTRVLQAPSRFRWHFEQAGVTYRFELIDDTGATLFEADPRDPSVQLPSSVKLSEGVPYTWIVSTRMPDGRKYSSTGDFSIVGSAVRKQVVSLRPAANAPVSERVAYAAWLEQLELRDEARKVWVTVAAERPDNGRVQALARE